MEVWVGLLGILLGGVVGSIGTYVTTKKRMNLEHALSHDRELRNLRLPYYQRLYQVSELIPREWQQGVLPSRSDLGRLREKCHKWYFGKGNDDVEDGAGGLYLTAPARAVYFRLMNELETVAQPGGTRSEVPTEEETHLLRDLASELRHQLVHDLGTAESPQLRWTLLGPTPAPPSLADQRAGLHPEAVDARTVVKDRMEQQRQAWEDHHRRQEFEHQLIDRKTAWLLTSQSLLFAAYGLSLGEGLGVERYQAVIRVLGISVSAVIWVGVLAVINAKRVSWKDYERHFQADRPAFAPASAWVDKSGNVRLPWGVRTANTWAALAPDALLPLVFITMWVLIP